MNDRRKLLLTLGAGALAAPFASLAQQKPGKIARVGLLGPGPAASVTGRTEAFRQGLRDLGHIEGKNIVID